VVSAVVEAEQSCGKRFSNCRRVFHFVLHFCMMMSDPIGGSQMSYKVSIVLERDDFGYYAYCPELKGCHSQGDSFEEVIANIREAIELYLETLSEEERRQHLSREILTTALEVTLA